MSSFELAEDQFKADAAVLRTRLTTPPGVAHAIVSRTPPRLTWRGQQRGWVYVRLKLLCLFSEL